MNFFIILTQYSLNNTIFQLKDHLLISNIHAIYTFLLSIVNVFGLVSTEFYLNMMFYSLFYCVYDIKYLYTNKSIGYLSLIMHHLLIIFSLSIINIYYSKNEEMIYLLSLNYITEISTPFLNHSFLLSKENKKNTKEFRINNLLLLTIFGLTRIAMIPRFIEKALSTNIMFVITFQLFLNLLNIIWYYKLVSYSLKHRYLILN